MTVNSDQQAMSEGLLVEEPGAVIDYPIDISGNQSSYTFTNGSTYRVTGNVTITGAATINGGAVINVQFRDVHCIQRQCYWTFFRNCLPYCG